jgi:Flp pilus assembly pilin Flp
MAPLCHRLPPPSYWRVLTGSLPWQLSAQSLGVRVSELRRFSSVGEASVKQLLQQLWFDERGQDIAEYAVMLAVILVIVVGTIRLIGSNANNVFSEVGSAIQ